MHILVNGWFWGNDTSGSGQYLHYLIARFSKLHPDEKHALTLVVPTTHIDKKSHSLPANTQLYEESLPRLPKQLAKVWWEQITIPNLARRLKADVLWVPYWAAPCWQPIPTVVTIHDVIPLRLPLYGNRRLQKMYTSLVTFSARRCKLIIAVSESSKRDIAQFLSVEPSKVAAVLSGPNLRIDPLEMESEAYVRKKYSLPESYFLYLGGFDVRKNVESVIKGYKAYLDKGGDSSVLLVIAGRLPQRYSSFFPDIEAMVNQLELEKSVRFCGFVEEKDKPLVYQLSISYLFPSLYEGFGMTIIEAMNAGAPTITSRG